MEDELWRMRQQSRILKEFREEIRSLWDDEAARTINMTLLNPHQEDDEHMIDGFVTQHQNIEICEQHRAIAEERATEATELSRQIGERIEQVDEDIEVSIQYEQQYRSFYAESTGLFPEIDSFIEQANTTGNGAPPYEP